MIYSPLAINTKTQTTASTYTLGAYVFTVAEGWWILNKRFKEIPIRYILWQ